MFVEKYYILGGASLLFYTDKPKDFAVHCIKKIEDDKERYFRMKEGSGHLGQHHLGSLVWKWLDMISDTKTDRLGSDSIVCSQIRPVC